MKTDRERADAFMKKWGLGSGVFAALRSQDEAMKRDLIALIVEVRADEIAGREPAPAAEGPTKELIAAACAVVHGRVPAVSSELFGAGSGTGWKHSRVSDSLTDRLARALRAIGALEPSSAEAAALDRAMDEQAGWLRLFYSKFAPNAAPKVGEALLGCRFRTVVSVAPGNEVDWEIWKGRR